MFKQKQNWILVLTLALSLQLFLVSSTSAAYSAQAIVTSKNLLAGNTALEITSFHYNIISLPGNSSVRVQFSQNNSTWYSAAGVSGAWDSLGTTGGSSVSLQALNWSGSAFYYRLELNATSDQSQSPIIASTRLDFSTEDGGDKVFVFDNFANVGIGVDTPKNRLDVSGAVAIGSAFAGINTAPANGLIVQGTVLIGTSTATSSKLYIAGVSGHAINTGGGRIKGLPSTINDLDEAVSKAYLHNNFTSSSTVSTISSSAWSLDGNTVGQNTGFGTKDDYSILFRTNGVERARLTNSGNFVLGASTTGTKLHVESPQGAVAFFKSTLNAGSYSGYIGNGQTYTNEEFGLYNAINDVRLASYNVTNDLLIYGGHLNNDPGLVIDSGGDVGIGTTNPSEKLMISDGNIKIGSSTTIGNAILAPYLSGGLIIKPEFNINDTTSAVLQIQKNDNSPLVTFQESGNVGIGTTSPSTKLQVYSGSPGYVINTSGGRIEGLPGTINKDDEAVSRKYLHDNFTSSSTSSSGSFWSGAKNGKIWNGDSGVGSVGIGTNNPTEKLEVVGGIKVSNDSNGIIISTHKGANSDGYNVFIGGGQNSIGQTGSSWLGSYNVSLGYNALSSNTTGYSNLAIGYDALRDNTTGANNVAIGPSTLKVNTGSNNSAIGTSVLIANTTGSDNAGQGYGALFKNTTGFENTAQGTYAMYNSTTGDSNTAQGSRALYSNTTGIYNTAQGKSALYYNTTGRENTAQGRVALHLNATGSYNTAVGDSALYSSTGSMNTSIGSAALVYNTSGSYNVAIGQNASRSIASGANNVSGSYSIFLGNNTRPLADAQTNQIVIGSSAIGLGSDSVVLGNDSIAKTALKGMVLIGTTTATTSKLYIAGVSGETINTGGGRIKGLPGTINDLDEAVSKAYLHDNFTSSSTTASLPSLWATSTAGTYNVGLGSVGIGTTSPATKFHVAGGARFESTTVLNDGTERLRLSWGLSPLGAIVQSGSGMGMYLGVNNSATTGIFINSSGNVGIGTTNPEAKFTIGSGYTSLEYDGFKSLNSPNTLAVQSGADTYYRWLGGSYGNASTLNFDLANTISKDKGNAGTGFRLTSGNGTGGTNNGYFSFSSLMANINETYTASEVMRITGTGNIGIGTTSPSTKLQVYSGSPGEVINTSGGRIRGLPNTINDADEAVSKFYVDNNFSPKYKPHKIVNNTDYTATDADYVIGYGAITANRTINLPDSLCVNGRFFVILDESGNAGPGKSIIIQPAGTTKIIGQNSFVLSAPYNSINVICGETGGNKAWFIL